MLLESLFTVVFYMQMKTGIKIINFKAPEGTSALI